MYCYLTPVHTSATTGEGQGLLGEGPTRVSCTKSKAAEALTKQPRPSGRK